MDNEIPIFLEEEKEKYNEDYILIRQYIKTDIWNLFKSVAQMEGLEVKHALNQAAKQWIISVKNLEYKCLYCDSKINKNNCIVIIKEGNSRYYCDVNCYNSYIKSKKNK